MTPRRIPNAITVASVPQIAAATWHANKVLNLGLAQSNIALLLAQIAFETGLGKAMHCWNLGNAKHVSGDGRNWTFFRCNEIINGKTVWFDPDHPACCFRAFDSLDEGAVDHLAMLRRNFSRVWPSLLAGDPVAFCADLKAARYYTADQGLYTRGVASLFNSLKSKLPADLDQVVMPWTAQDEALVAELCPGNAQRMVSIGVCEPYDPTIPVMIHKPHTTESRDALALGTALAKDEVAAQLSSENG